MAFEVTILGSSSATPIYNRHPTSQLLNIRERCFLIDCGEGTLMQLLRFKIRYHRISHIFISHLHGDHYLGLMGLLSTFHLQGRTGELHLYGQQELMDVLEMQLRLSNTQLRYNLIFHPVRHYTAEVILETEDLLVRSIVLNHRVPCTGFVFMEKSKPRKLIVSKLQQHNIPFSSYNRIKHGENFEDDFGNIIPNKELTEDPPLPKSYAYCSDTIYDEGIINDVSGVDLLYHEATFLHENLERAQQTYHTTSKQAATIALRAGVKKLIIGHFSGRYKDLTPLLEEAQTVFPESDLALEGRRFRVG
jgi:ribonuclease Z